MADANKKPEGHSEDALPHVDFSTFVLSLSHSALMHLGEAPSPETGSDRAEPAARAPDHRPPRRARGEDEGQPDRGRRAPPRADPLRSPDALRRAVEDEVMPRARASSPSCACLVACGAAATAPHVPDGDDAGGRHPAAARPPCRARRAAAGAAPRAAARRGRARSACGSSR